MLGRPRSTSEQSSADTPMPSRIRASLSFACSSPSAVIVAPISTSLPPDWYLVSACTEMSTPCSNGLNARPAEYVLSIAVTMPRARATAVIARTSGTSIVTEPGASSQTMRVFGWIRSAMPAPIIGS